MVVNINRTALKKSTCNVQTMNQFDLLARKAGLKQRVTAIGNHSNLAPFNYMLSKKSNTWWWRASRGTVNRATEVNFEAPRVMP